MRKLACIAVLMAAMPLAAAAQQAPAADASIGYSFLRLGGSGGSNQNGVSGSMAYNLNSWLGVAADFGGYHSSPQGVGLTTFTYMFGPRLTYRTNSKVNPFAEVLFGAGHLKASAGGVSVSSSPFAYAFGGGADLNVSENISFRPQVDYIGLRSNGSTENCARISAAVVFHFGQSKGSF
ncbi:MAG TPA: outer membrane beta-barrel protein [Candidatus Acidoferrales bacterium]|nr:outer membrane beta-barrel protein [Candidatus Acidoferrales bacterium]